MAAPNLETLIIFSNSHLEQISSCLSANAHKSPFKLRVIESNLIYRPKLHGFLESQPQIKELGEYRPNTDLYLEVLFLPQLDPFLPHILPSLRTICRSISDIQELAPNCPVDSIMIHQAYDHILALSLEYYDCQPSQPRPPHSASTDPTHRLSAYTMLSPVLTEPCISDANKALSSQNATSVSDLSVGMDVPVFKPLLAPHLPKPFQPVDLTSPALIKELRQAMDVEDLAGQLEHTCHNQVARGGYSKVYITQWRCRTAPNLIPVC